MTSATKPSGFPDPGLPASTAKGLDWPRRRLLGSLLGATLAPGALAKSPSALGNTIGAVVREEIAAGHLPGAVIAVLIGGKPALVEAYGERTVVPRRTPMTLDTVFDAASLTKVVATTVAVLQMVERRHVELDRTVAAYWPQFAENGKRAITVRQLMTHYSGLPQGLPSGSPAGNAPDVMSTVQSLAPVTAAGARFSYSDVDFIVLGELVRRVTGLSLDAYCRTHIFAPLGMRETQFLPPEGMRGRIAPAEATQEPPRWGKVQDPTAYRMGGVAGHAGLFTTAADLLLFVDMLLSGGGSVLSPVSIAEMIKVQSPPGHAALRGLGWDIDSPYARTLAPSFSPQSFGHTGYTGTALWVEPSSRSALIVLSNRLHPDGSGNIATLLRRVAGLVGTASRAAGRGTPSRVLSGCDVLESYGFHSLKGLRIGLITNRSARSSSGRPTAEVLAQARSVRLAALFSPEHGLEAAAEGKIAHATDPASGIPVHSLYGDARRPTEAMLQGLDAIVLDLQDVGARFYTYATTMAYAMEAAARRGLPFLVLDRPNPVNAVTVQGPPLDADLTSFVTYLPIPVRHGMTMGELARMFNEERRIGAKLSVVAMRYYNRAAWYDDTGLAWVPPSPNLRSVTQAILYPGIALLEGANISVGRGTDQPFEIVGAPWIDGRSLLETLRRRAIQGVQFALADFTPRSATFAGQHCSGVAIHVTDRSLLNTPLLGIEIIAAIHRLFGSQFQIDRTLGLVGSRDTLQAIKSGIDTREIERSWSAPNEQFLQRRQRYLLY